MSAAPVAAQAPAAQHVARVALSRPARYIFVPVCSCGWISRGYAADHAAQILVDDHAAKAAE